MVARLSALRTARISITKRKQFRYRPVVAQRVNKLWFPCFLTTAHDGGKVASLTDRPHLYYKSKVVPLQAWSGPEGSRKLMFPDYLTTKQDGGKVVSLKHRPHLTPGNIHGAHFSSRLSRPRGHSAIRMIYVNKKFQ
jgi:hypothetical protein